MKQKSTLNICRKNTESQDEIKEQKNELNKKAKQKDATEEDKLAAREANLSITIY